MHTALLNESKVGRRAMCALCVLKIFWEMEHMLTVDQRSFLFVCFVALRPKSTAMVIAGRSVHLNILFPGQA